MYVKNCTIKGGREGAWERHSLSVIVVEDLIYFKALRRI
jgi:hypothetical protein